MVTPPFRPHPDQYLIGHYRSSLKSALFVRNERNRIQHNVELVVRYFLSCKGAAAAVKNGQQHCPSLMLLRYFGCKIVGHPAVRVRPVGRSTTKQCRSPPAPSFGPVLNAACGKVTMRANPPCCGREGGILIALFPWSSPRWPRRIPPSLSLSLPLSLSPPCFTSIFSRSHEFPKRVHPLPRKEEG